ncbi:hypothetical protein [Yoonia maritima]|uniref:hypothetical protein n=1 Tax=Yoonia maritima TaxID=1435347 RepID=UPI0037366058
MSITKKTLEGVLRVREADAVVQAIIDTREAEEAATELARQRHDGDLVYQQELEWMAKYREIDAQRKARGWKPMTIGAAPPDQRRRFTLTPPSQRKLTNDQIGQ